MAHVQCPWRQGSKAILGQHLTGFTELQSWFPCHSMESLIPTPILFFPLPLPFPSFPSSLLLPPSLWKAARKFGDEGECGQLLPFLLGHPSDLEVPVHLFLPKVKDT